MVKADKDTLKCDIPTNCVERITSARDGKPK